MFEYSKEAKRRISLRFIEGMWKDSWRKRWLMEKFEFKRIKNESSNEELEVCKCRFVGRMKRSLRMLKSRRKKRKGCELMEKFVKERRFVGRVEKFLKDSRKSSRMLNTSKYIEFYVCWTFRFIEEIKRFFEKRNHRSESLLILRTNIFIEEPNTFTKETIPPRWKVSIETSKNIKFFFEFISSLNLSWKKKINNGLERTRRST